MASSRSRAKPPPRHGPTVRPDVHNCNVCDDVVEVDFNGRFCEYSGFYICESCDASMTRQMEDDDYRTRDWSDYDDDDENADDDFWVD